LAAVFVYFGGGRGVTRVRRAASSSSNSATTQSAAIASALLAAASCKGPSARVSVRKTSTSYCAHVEFVGTARRAAMAAANATLRLAITSSTAEKQFAQPMAGGVMSAME